MMDFLDQFDINLANLLLRLVIIAVVLVIGRWLAGFVRRWLARSMQRYGLTESLISLVTTVAFYGVLILAAAVALAVLGVPVSVITSALGIVTIVLAITLQSSLANLAATVNFILFKPLEVGDFIQTAGVMGAVQEIQLFSTVIVSPDRKTHVITNAAIQGAGITNFSKFGSIRADQVFRVSYASDVDKAQKALSEVLYADDRVLEQPAPAVFVGRLADDHIEIVAWPFVAITDYLPFQSDIARNVMQAFDAAGINIPLPQQEVRLLG